VLTNSIWIERLDGQTFVHDFPARILAFSGNVRAGGLVVTESGAVHALSAGGAEVNRVADVGACSEVVIGKYIYALRRYYGEDALACYARDGTRLWSRDIYLDHIWKLGSQNLLGLTPDHGIVFCHVPSSVRPLYARPELWILIISASFLGTRIAFALGSRELFISRTV
jgi:hypothetical protein